MEIDPEMERLYMPSRWVVRVPPEDSVPLHVRVTMAESERVRREEQGSLGVRYGRQEGDWLDMFNEQGEGQVVTYISGGYWKDLSGELSAYPVSPLVRAGHSVAVVNYTRTPAQALQDMQDQVVRASAWLVSWAQERGKKVYLMGHSAGSHLAAMILSSTWYDGLPRAKRQVIGGVIHLSGVFHLPPLLRTSVAVPGLGLDSSTAQGCSPAHVDNLTMITRSGQHLVVMVVTGEHDSPTFQQQGDQYSAALAAAGLTVLRTVEKAEDHFSLVEKLADGNYRLTQDILRLVDGVYK